jgi:hypothetical protein
MNPRNDSIGFAPVSPIRSPIRSPIGSPFVSGFDPFSGPGLALWRDPAFGAFWERTSPITPTVAIGDPLGTWNAKSGQVSTAPTNGSRPLLRYWGSQPNFEFDGSDDQLVDSPTPNLGFHHLFVVMRGTVAARDLISNGVNTSGTFLMQLDSSGFLKCHYWGATGNSISTGAVDRRNTWGLAEQRFRSAGMTGYWNGTSDGTAAWSGTLGNSANNVILGNRSGGGGGFWSGNIAEILLYLGELADVDVVRIRTYLNAKYQLF